MRLLFITHFPCVHIVLSIFFFLIEIIQNSLVVLHIFESRWRKILFGHSSERETQKFAEIIKKLHLRRKDFCLAFMICEFFSLPRSVSQKRVGIPTSCSKIFQMTFSDDRRGKKEREYWELGGEKRALNRISMFYGRQIDFCEIAEKEIENVFNQIPLTAK